ncbi:hypothetical protein NL676_005377 [Syzygium grande]|nr:hypothetical protein NL676_005377 [Syzygium grande]
MAVAAESADKREQEAILSFPHCSGSTVVEPESRRTMNSTRARVKSPPLPQDIAKNLGCTEGNETSTRILQGQGQGGHSARSSFWWLPCRVINERGKGQSLSHLSV